MPELFLSYARDDQAVARRFADGFEREGLGVWWDQALNPGEAFDQVTEEALAGASAVIVLWSKASVSSRWVRAEATQANASHRLLPVMIEPCTRPIMFELTHTADLTQWKGNPDDPAWQAFVASVRRFVQRAQGGSATAPGVMAPLRAPRPSLLERLAAIGAGLRDLAMWLGRLLRRHGGRLAFAIAGATIATLIAWQQRPQPEHAITRFTIDVPADLATDQALGPGIALSPDGRRVVYPGGGQLWSRRLDQDEATEIPGAEEGTQPFFSPDGRSVGFFTITADPAKNQLKAFDFGTESVRVLAGFKDVPGVIGSWNYQGHIIFAPGDLQSMSRVPAVGGVPEVVVKRGDYGAVGWQDSLPGSPWLLFTGVASNGNWGDADIVAQNLDSGERKVVVKRGHAARYVSSGHLVFARGGTLYAVAFDAKRAEARGREVPVVQGVATNEANGYAPYTIGADGSLAYVSGTMVGQSRDIRSVVRVDQRGETVGLSADARTYSTPRASPDGSMVAVEVTDSDKHVHIWVMDTKTGGATQVTFDSDEDRYPVWTADSREILYVSRRSKEFALWRKAADGTGAARKVLAGTDSLVATDVHGHTLVYQDRGAGEERDLFTLDLTENGKPQVLLSTPDDESSARVSPDGKWLAYVSTPKGGSTPDRKVYVRPFANAAAGGLRPVSEGQGAGPIWSPKGDEIYYFVAGGPIPIMAVQLAATPTTITPTSRRQLFVLRGRFDLTRTSAGLGYAAIYDVMPKGGEFVAVLNAPVKPSGNGGDNQAGVVARPQLHVVLNWAEELKKLVPTE
jgi:Tol biopolymer transport system component